MQTLGSRCSHIPPEQEIQAQPRGRTEVLTLGLIPRSYLTEVLSSCELNCPQPHPVYKQRCGMAQSKSDPRQAELPIPPHHLPVSCTSTGGLWFSFSLSDPRHFSMSRAFRSHSY